MGEVMAGTDIDIILKQNCDWNLLRDKSVLITGATGLIGTVLVDMLKLLNETFSLNLKLFLVSRSEKESDDRFVSYIKQDIAMPWKFEEKADFIIHAASNTHPLQYSMFPVETITANVFGTYNLLEMTAGNKGCRFLFVSSVEVYGEDVMSLEKGFSETDMGFLDCNNPRACYNESKRLGETLCAAFSAQKGVDYVVARLCRCYGPTLKKDDSKALSQFLRNAVAGENIILKSKGNQFYSYLYAADAAAAVIFLLINGKPGEAYNVADGNSNITLKDLACSIAKLSGTKVHFELPEENEQKGFSKSQRAVLNPDKIHELGWKASFSMEQGLKRTLQCLGI